MRRGQIAAVLAIGTAGLVAAGSGISAWANWDTNPPSGQAQAITGRVPAVAQPKAEMSGSKPKVVWTKPETAPDRAVTGYVLVRVHAGASQVVCKVPATTRTCVDNVPPAGSVTYVVRATAGTWFGPDSPPSASLPISVATATLAKLTAPASPSTDPGRPAGAAPGPAAPALTSTTEPTTKPAAEPLTTTPAPTEKAEDDTAPPPASSPAEAKPATTAAEPSASGSADEGIPE